MYGAVPPVAVPENPTTNGASPARGPEVDLADRGTMAVIVSGAAEARTLFASVTLKLTVYVPAMA